MYEKFFNKNKPMIARPASPNSITAPWHHLRNEFTDEYESIKQLEKEINRMIVFVLCSVSPILIIAMHEQTMQSPMVMIN